MDVMVDIETLGTNPDSAILSIGATTFNYNGYKEGSANSCFYCTIKPDLNKYSATYDTIKWWITKSPNAKKVFDTDTYPPYTTGEALYRLHCWLTPLPFHNIWSHGSNFDIILLENAFRTESLTIPWTYKQVKDTRTLFSLTDTKIKNIGVEHNALDDAVAQAHAVIAAYEKIATWKVYESHPIKEIGA